MRFYRALLLVCVVVLFVAPLVVAEEGKLKPVKPPVDLLAGAKWQYSVDGKNWTKKLYSVSVGKKKTVLGKLRFVVQDTSQYTCLELAKFNTRQRYYLNGTRLTGPLKKMRYKTFGAILAKLLRKGSNTLTTRQTVHNKKPKKGMGKPRAVRFKPILRGMKPEHLKFDIKPILGAFGPDYFTVTCRTNIPASVTVDIRETTECLRVDKFRYDLSRVEFPDGLIHRFRVKVKRGAISYNYQIKVTCQGRAYRTISGKVTIPPSDSKNLRFVAMGDSRTYPKAWKKVAAAVLRDKPAFVVFSGDMVTTGWKDWHWVEQFCAPARELLATIPFYAVIGNHEQKAPLYYGLFYTPYSPKNKVGLGVNWFQQIGPVLLIGIEGTAKFAPESENYKWLNGVLSESKAKFIFLFNHYPAWSSGHHGRLNKKGLPRERTSQVAQKYIVPLLNKHNATAYINGHDHMYERSEHPDGLTMITSGGAGAPLYRKTKNAAAQNPYSKVFASKHHYCLIEVSGDTCTMKAVTPAGKVIDTRKWKARK